MPLDDEELAGTVSVGDKVIALPNPTRTVQNRKRTEVFTVEDTRARGRARHLPVPVVPVEENFDWLRGEDDENVQEK